MLSYQEGWWLYRLVFCRDFCSDYPALLGSSSHCEKAIICYLLVDRQWKTLSTSNQNRKWTHCHCWGLRPATLGTTTQTNDCLAESHNKFLLLQTPMCVGVVMCQSWGSVSFFLSFFLCLLPDFSQTRPYFSISFCRHLEQCLQHYWTSYIEMLRFLEL
jgi:hypothetical protein